MDTIDDGKSVPPPSIEELLASGRNCNTVHEMVLKLRDLLEKSTDPNSVPFKVPVFSSGAHFLEFIASLMQDEWLAVNGLIVCFDAPGGGRRMGIGRLCDFDFFLSDAGKSHLRSENVTTYIVHDYGRLLLQARSTGSES